MAADKTDVAIIGGGIMGSAVAWRLAQRGVGVTVVERGIPGAEASSAAAGILGPQMEAEGPGPLLELGLASRALYPSLSAELRDATGIDVGYDRSGVLAAALDDDGERGARGAARVAAAAQPQRRLAVGRRGARARAGAGSRRSAPRWSFRTTVRSTRASWRARSRRRRPPRARAS